MTNTSRLYGLTVESPFVLGHPASAGLRPDVRITVDDLRTTVDGGADLLGRKIAAYSPGRPHYELYDRGAEGYFYRIHNVMDMLISPDTSEVNCRLVVGAPEGVVPVMLAGHVLATLLLLRGELVFHASAVEVDDRAVAFVGNSGGGKSTLAAIACRQGARLVSDDVLRVEPAGDDTVCYRGGSLLRLRPGSKALAEQADPPFDAGLSADGRHLLAWAPTPLDRLPVEAVFIPRLRDADHVLSRTALDPTSALFALLQFPRVQNWQDPETSASHFERLAALVQAVPVYFLDVPWGIPIEPSWFQRFGELILDGEQRSGVRGLS